MPTVFSHIAVPVAARLGLGAQAVPPRLLAAGLVASVLPDADVVSFHLGIPYGDAFGHRGASHSFLAALLMGLLAAWLAPFLRARRIVAFAFVAVSAASHGVLDMLTNGGSGVAVWWPLSDERHFLPWQVVEVSPISVQRFLAGRGLEVLQSEFVWIWLPCLSMALALLAARSLRARA